MNTNATWAPRKHCKSMANSIFFFERTVLMMSTRFRHDSFAFRKIYSQLCVCASTSWTSQARIKSYATRVRATRRRIEESTTIFVSIVSTKLRVDLLYFVVWVCLGAVFGGVHLIGIEMAHATIKYIKTKNVPCERINKTIIRIILYCTIWK